MKVESIVEYCETLYRDLDLASVKEWKSRRPNRKAIGFLPIYVPREIVHASGMLPVGIMGGGDQVEIIRGDSYFQSYICHIPRSTIELGLTDRLDTLDGMLFPSICDVIRNLSGMWKILFPDKYVKYLDLPQNFNLETGGEFYLEELRTLKRDFEGLTGIPVSTEALNRSIRLYNENRRLVSDLYDLRRREPWSAPTSECYLLLRAGNLLDVEEHSRLLQDYMHAASESGRASMDNSRVVLRGGFCEQPPLGFIRTLERAGCYIVDDDFVLVSRWYVEPVRENGDPMRSLVEAYLGKSTCTAARYDSENTKGQDLVASVRRHEADGVVFCAPSFCDPALLDQPMLVAVCEREGIPFTYFKYSENSGQFQVIREQAGTFSDSIKLWGEA